MCRIMNGTHSDKEEGDKKDVMRAMVATGRSEKAGSHGNSSSQTHKFPFTRNTSSVGELSWLVADV